MCQNLPKGQTLRFEEDIERLQELMVSDLRRAYILSNPDERTVPQ
jgi:hypothetical protein